MGEQTMKTKMSNQRQLTTVMALLLVVAAVLACNLGDETGKANKLVDEGNAAVQDAKKYYEDAEEKKENMINAVDAIKNDADLEAARAIAKEAIVAYDKTKAKCEEVSKKYEEASKLKIKDKFKEYLTLKTSEFKKRAEIVDTAKGIPQALIDSKNKASFNSSAKTISEKVDKLTKEADDLGAQADKLQKDNKDIFKS
jgi:membrane-associated HD superfamily phosphohydrolase